MFPDFGDGGFDFLQVSKDYCPADVLKEW